MADTLPRCWPRASLVWPSLSDQEEGIPSLASPSFGHGVSLLLLAPDSTPFIPLLTGWFPCSLVGSGSPCSLVGSPALWLGLVLPAHWLVPPGPGLPPWPPSAPPTWHMASSTCPQLLLASHPRHGPYCMCQAWRSATHLTPNIPSTTVLDSRRTRPTDTSPDPAASEWGLSLAPEMGEGPGTLAWSHHQALTGAAGGLAEQKA